MPLVPRLANEDKRVRMNCIPPRAHVEHIGKTSSPRPDQPSQYLEARGKRFQQPLTPLLDAARWHFLIPHRAHTDLLIQPCPGELNKQNASELSDALQQTSANHNKVKRTGPLEHLWSLLHRPMHVVALDDHRTCLRDRIAPSHAS